MDKSIIITGKKGSGKTTKMNELLSKFDKSETAVMYFLDVFCSDWRELRKKTSIIGIEEFTMVDHLDFLYGLCELYDFKFIMVTQMNLKEVDPKLLSHFEIIECNYQER